MWVTWLPVDRWLASDTCNQSSNQEDEALRSFSLPRYFPISAKSAFSIFIFPEWFKDRVRSWWSDLHTGHPGGIIRCRDQTSRKKHLSYSISVEKFSRGRVHFLQKKPQINHPDAWFTNALLLNLQTPLQWRRYLFCITYGQLQTVSIRQTPFSIALGLQVHPIPRLQKYYVFDKI